jgi:hypothetical protein
MSTNTGYDELAAAIKRLQVTSLADQLRELRAMEDSVKTVKVLKPSRSSTASNTGGTGGSVLSTLGSLLGGGFGIASFVSGLTGLFSGSEASTGPTFVRYSRPGAIHAEAAISSSTGGRVFAVDSGQGGLPRGISSADAVQVSIPSQEWNGRLFLDHSQEIALAVRQAMLETSVLNDVIREV